MVTIRAVSSNKTPFEWKWRHRQASTSPKSVDLRSVGYLPLLSSTSSLCRFNIGPNELLAGLDRVSLTLPRQPADVSSTSVTIVGLAACVAVNPLFQSAVASRGFVTTFIDSWLTREVLRVPLWRNYQWCRSHIFNSFITSRHSV